MASEGKITTDHETIRRWAEERKGKPATVKGTGDGEPGILRIDFPGYGEEDKLAEISWDDFFEKFEESQLAFLYQDTVKKGRFFKFVNCDSK